MQVQLNTKPTKPTGFHCDYCGKNLSRSSQSSVSLTTGYGYPYDEPHLKHCFGCCAVQDREQLETSQKVTLYLSYRESMTRSYGSGLETLPRKVYYVSNWPGTMEFPAQVSKGRHNWGLNRYDVWFRDHKGNRWWGVQIGDNTQLVHCKKLKGD